MFTRQSLRYKINITIVSTLISVSLVFGAALSLYEIQRRNSTTQQIEQSLADLTSQFSEVLGNEIFSGHSMAINATIAEVMQRRSILAIATYDEFGEQLITSSDTEKGRLQESELKRLAIGPVTSFGTWNDLPVLTFTSPIVAYGENVGFWRIHYSLVTMKQETLELVLIFAALMVSLAVLIGWLMNTILMRFVVHPVRRLKNAMLYIQEGKGESEVIEEGNVHPPKLERMIEAFDELPHDLVQSHKTGDEIGSLALSFQQMLVTLGKAYTNIYTDALTGLHNRRKLDEILQEESDRSQRYQYAFSCILLDIDDFKKVNDTFGHLVGDEVLIGIAQILKNNLRKTDLPGRWGGEEFLILLPQQNIRTATTLAEKLRKAVACSNLPEVGSITSSFGVAEFQSDDSVVSFIARADECLYLAKAKGKNKVVAG